jgi:hypothetical protein
MAAQEMSRTQAVDCIKFAIESSGNVKLPIAVWGLHGVGKTEMMKVIAKELNMNLVVLHLATQDVADLIGIPRDMEIKDGKGNVVDKITIWSCPDWLHNAIKQSKETGKKNLFFLDEMNRGNRMVLAAMLPFLIEGTLHTHRINEQDAIVAAMNPPTEDYEVNDLIDKAALDRLGHIILRPTANEYIQYLKDTSMDKTTLSVLKEDPSWIKIPEFELNFEVKPSRRKIDYVMRILGKKGKGWVKEHASHILECYLGSNFRDVWLEHYGRQGETITIEMLQDYKSNKDEITNALKTEIDGQTTVRMDLLTKAVGLIKQYIDDKKESITIKDAQWMTDFLSNPLVEDEYCATIFEANKHIRTKMLNDMEFNVYVGNFLREKQIWVDDGGVKAW